MPIKLDSALADARRRLACKRGMPYVWAIWLAPRPLNCGSTYQIQWVWFRPASSSDSATS